MFNDFEARIKKLETETTQQLRDRVKRNDRTPAQVAQDNEDAKSAAELGPKVTVEQYREIKAAEDARKAAAAASDASKSTTPATLPV